MDTKLLALIKYLPQEDKDEFFENFTTDENIYNYIINLEYLPGSMIVSEIINIWQNPKLQQWPNGKLYYSNIETKYIEIYNAIQSRKNMKIIGYSSVVEIKITDKVYISVYTYTNKFYKKTKLHRTYIYTLEDLKDISYIKFILNNTIQLIEDIQYSSIKLPNAYRNLQGPISIFYLEHPKYPFKICMLGDYHSITNIDCPDNIKVNKWIKEYIDSDLSVDLYLEYMYYNLNIDNKILDTIYPDKKLNILKVREEINNRNDTPSSDYMNEVRKEFDVSCFKFDKKDCKLNNSRIHNIDIRRFNLISIIELFNEYNWTNDEETKFLFTISSYMPYFILYLKNYTAYYNMFTAYGYSDRKILKQFENISSEYSDIKNILLSNYNREKELFSKNFKPLSEVDITEAMRIFKYKNYEEFIKNEDKFKLISIFNNLKEFSKNNIEGNMLFMDYYLLGRLFRSYTNAQPSYNSIIYTGGFHTSRYKEILLQIGFNLIYADENIEIPPVFSEYRQVFNTIINKFPSSVKQCLNISGLKQPLFV